MKIKLDKDIFEENIKIVSRFTSGRINTPPALQGIFIKSKKGIINFYTTDLNVFSHTKIIRKDIDEFEFTIDPKNILEFLKFLKSGDLDLEINEKQIRISQGKTKGTFPTILIEDFPIPPEISGSGEKIETSILTKNLPSLLFTAALDESRPVLTGVNFITEEDNLTMVSTDGFRLSILTLKKQTGFKPMIIPANFLKEIIQYLSEKEETIFKYDEKNKIISFETKKGTFYSRLIEGDFPPYKKVLPEEKKTTIKLKRDDLLKKTKMISIFAREQSSVVVFDFKKDGLTISPKKQIGEENKTTQEIEIEGEEMRVAFNYKYLVDFLNNSEGETTIIDLLRPDAPVVFKSDKNKNFIHIIMPVRIQDVV